MIIAAAIAKQDAICYGNRCTRKIKCVSDVNIVKEHASWYSSITRRAVGVLFLPDSDTSFFPAI